MPHYEKRFDCARTVHESNVFIPFGLLLSAHRNLEFATPISTVVINQVAAKGQHLSPIPGACALRHQQSQNVV